MSQSVVLLLGLGDDSMTVGRAFAHARKTHRGITVLQFLTSDLYFYGQNDLIATRPSKRKFLTHIRNEVIERAKERALRLDKLAQSLGVAMNIHFIEAEDIVSTVVKTISEDCEIIFISREKKSFFPLFKRSLEKSIARRVTCQVVAC